jgi:acetyl-CoA carboxylase biotin carboxyl carrier protein
MDLRKIKKLIDLLEESNLAELEIKEGEEIVRLSRVPKGMVSTMAMAPAPMQAQRMEAPPAPAGAAAETAPAGGGRGVPEGHVV